MQDKAYVQWVLGHQSAVRWFDLPSIAVFHEPDRDFENEDADMSATNFIKDYEAALGTQNWATVAPLISDHASVIFSDGSLHMGKEAIKAAYERNFTINKSEDYRIEKVRWMMKAAGSAAYMFEFYWTGLIDGQEASGSGRGTAVLAHEAGRWVLIGEQLGSMR